MTAVKAGSVVRREAALAIRQGAVQLLERLRLVLAKDFLERLGKLAIDGLPHISLGDGRFQPGSREIGISWKLQANEVRKFDVNLVALLGTAPGIDGSTKKVAARDHHMHMIGVRIRMPNSDPGNGDRIDTDLNEGNQNDFAPGCDRRYLIGRQRQSHVSGLTGAA